MKRKIRHLLLKEMKYIVLDKWKKKKKEKPITRVTIYERHFLVVCWFILQTINHCNTPWKDKVRSLYIHRLLSFSWITELCYRITELAELHNLMPIQWLLYLLGIKIHTVGIEIHTWYRNSTSNAPFSFRLIYVRYPGLVRYLDYIYLLIYNIYLFIYLFILFYFSLVYS